MPAIVYVSEQHDSRGWSYDGGKVTTKRTFNMYATGTAVLNSPFTVRQWFGIAVAGTVGSETQGGPDALPSQGELFPAESGVWARSYEITRLSESDVWQVVWTYGNAQVSPSTAQPGEVGFVEWTLDIQAGFTETYVTAPSFPSNGTVGATPALQLVTGGVHIDIEGVPLSRLRYTSEIVINETIQSTSGVPAQIATARLGRGKRNNGTWETIVKGKALYVGAQIRRTGVSLYQITHRIVEDDEYHLVQVPERDATGKIPTIDYSGVNRARNVYFRQPFPDFVDFASLSANW